MNESKTLAIQISCKCESKFDGRKCNSNRKRKNNKCWCEYENLKEDDACIKRLYLEPCYIQL